MSVMLCPVAASLQSGSYLREDEAAPKGRIHQFLPFTKRKITMLNNRSCGSGLSHPLRQPLIAYGLLILLALPSRPRPMRMPVTEGDKNISRSQRRRADPVRRGQHMVAGLRSLLFLFGVVFFLYKVGTSPSASISSPSATQQRCWLGSILAGTSVLV
jgi:hypothetical protein